MATKKYIQSELVDGSPAGARITYVCDTYAERPTSGLAAGDILLALDAPSGRLLYVAIDATTWRCVANENASGVVPMAQIATGTPTGSKFVRDDGTLQIPPGGGGTPSDTVSSETSFGVAAAAGSSTDYSRGDHTHGSPSLGTTGTTACAGNDARLSDARTPTAHEATHRSAGSDPLSILNLGGFPGGTSTFLRADASFASPAGGAVNIKQTEIDFGATPAEEASFVVTDADVSPTSQIIGSVAYEAPTGKDLDELDMDGLDLKFAPGSGQFTVYARGQDGYIADKFKLNYLVG